ncbi:hypothetical protein BTVI_72117 [Pitangus sulphuratus]|nr:hypothetical protein BTVI_72117 [Pitangus sulphuratus]
MKDKCWSILVDIPETEFEIIVVRMFRESSSKTNIAMETYFLGRICHLHYQVPVWSNAKTSPGCQFCKEPLNRFTGTCDPESPGIAICKGPDSHILQG